MVVSTSCYRPISGGPAIAGRLSAHPQYVVARQRGLAVADGQLRVMVFYSSCGNLFLRQGIKGDVILKVVTTLAQDAAPETTEKIDHAIQEFGSKVGDALHGDTSVLIQLGKDYGLPILWAVIILVMAYVVAGVIGRATARSLIKAKVEETLARFFGKVARYVLLTFGVIFALSKFGIDVTAFAAVLAAAGFAVGMALSGTLSNFAAGVMILIFRPFKVGDYIVVSGEEGTVEEVELFTTTVNTLDNRHIILPNGSIFGSVIQNVTHNPMRRVDVNVGVAYEADMKQTRSVLQEAIANIQDAVADRDPSGDPSHAPQVYLVELGDSSVNWQVRVWCAPAVYWDVRERLTEAAKDGLDRAGISIPFPQMDVHVEGKLG